MSSLYMEVRFFSAQMNSEMSSLQGGSENQL